MLYLLARAATSYCRLGSLIRNVSSQILEAPSPKIKICTGLVPSESREGESLPCLSPSFEWLAGFLWCSWLVEASL